MMCYRYRTIVRFYYEMGAVIDCADANVEEDMQYDVLSISHDRIDYYELKNNGVYFRTRLTI